MKIKKYLNNGGKFFSENVETKFQTYYGAVPEWLNGNLLSMVELTALDDFSMREMLFDFTQVDAETITEVCNRCERLLIRNKQKYDHLYNLFEQEYNPIWNVDGTTTTERTVEDSRTTGNSDNTTLTHNVNVGDTGSETTTYNTLVTGSDDTTITYGKQEDKSEEARKTLNLAEDSTKNDSRTTFDSNTFYDTDKSVEGKTNTGTELNEVTSGVSLSGDDRTENDTSEAKTGTETKQKTNTQTTTGTETTASTGSGTEAGETNESVTETRHGNIGVTTTQKMAMEEVSYADYIKFIDIITLDVVRAISYGC